jgi:hypothetical protein
MWKVHIDVAGEPVNVVGKEMVTILPESIGPVDHLPGPHSLAAATARKGTGSGSASATLVRAGAGGGSDRCQTVMPGRNVAASRVHGA